MIKIEQKIVKNKPFFYISEQISVGGKFKKIQVYLGKNIPNDLSNYYVTLKAKEANLIIENIGNLYQAENHVDFALLKKLETQRLNFKYHYHFLSEYRKEMSWRDFAIKFIYESNAIEGSKLSEREVGAIVRGGYVSKNIDRKELREVENSIKAFDNIRSDKFELNQRSIIRLHKLLVEGLDVVVGYKQKEIVVNNKPTTPAGEIRSAMANLLKWWQGQKKENINPFILATKFHQRFESIHPFEDGNGRVGRLIYIWMLFRSGYGVILFRNQGRRAYFTALDQADQGRPRKLYTLSIDVYKKTITELINSGL